MENILNTLIINNNLYNNQFQTLVSNLQIELKKIVSQTQLELINNIAKDYNINSKELIKKYVNQKKQPNIVIDSPTFDIISKYYNSTHGEKTSNKSSNSNVSDDQTSYSSTIINSDGILFGIDDDSKVKSKTKGKPGRKKSITTENEKEKEKEKEKEREIEVIDNDSFTLFKPINIKGRSCLLNIKTNEIFDENNVCIGIKKENKYFIKKT